MRYDNDYIYGKINLAYADFYYGELNNLEWNCEYDLNEDKAASMRAAGQYDAVTSATKVKSKRSQLLTLRKRKTALKSLARMQMLHQKYVEGR